MLARIPGVTLGGCDRGPARGHGTAWSDRFARTATGRIVGYIRARPAAAPWGQRSASSAGAPDSG